MKHSIALLTCGSPSSAINVLDCWASDFGLVDLHVVVHCA
jgi:hypothetical protein